MEPTSVTHPSEVIISQNKWLSSAHFSDVVRFLVARERFGTPLLRTKKERGRRRHNKIMQLTLRKKQDFGRVFFVRDDIRFYQDDDSPMCIRFL